MRIALDNRLLRNIALFINFIGFLFYLGVFNRYHLSYLEQTQLFRYDQDYLADYFTKPGGLINILGSFITQFFHIPWIGALILTLILFTIFLLTQYIFRKSGLNGILFSLMPLILLAALHSNHNYPVAYTMGWLLSLLSFAAFINQTDAGIRFWTGIVSFVLLYYLCGVFSFLTMILCIFHELYYGKGYKKYLFLITVIPLAVLIPFISWKYIYLLPLKQAWFSPVVFSSVEPVKVFFYLLALYYPVVILITFVFLRVLHKTTINFSWNQKHLIPGIILYGLAVYMLVQLAYDRNNELFLGIDASYHAESWKKVLALSEKYPGQNQLVLYYTNLALYKTGNMPNTMFHYRQSGTKGLWLKWERNETAPFFGGEVYYDLGYINEAFRWAFEAMEVKGLNPRSLERLVVTSMINGNYKLAAKYLNFLNQTLYYRKWAGNYERMIADTTLIYQQKELQEKRKFLLNKDFIAYNNSSNIGLDKLLEGHPDNRMAFEYLMASFLLRKDLDAFAANIYRLKELGYEKIPKHYEEALVLYSGLSGKNAIPPGYAISSVTREGFHEYAKIFATNRYDMNKAAQALYNNFGSTFWFYMQFAELNPESTRSNQ